MSCGPVPAGSLRSRMKAKMAIPTSTRTANTSSAKRTIGHVPMIGNAKFAMKSSPKASITVMPRIRKPPNTRAWAMPGTLHLSSFFCPSTSVNCVSTRAGTWSVRPMAGWPERMRPWRKRIRRNASPPAATMSTTPTAARMSII